MTKEFKPRFKASQTVARDVLNTAYPKLKVPPHKGAAPNHPDGVALTSVAMTDEMIAEQVAGLAQSGALVAMSTQPVSADGTLNFVVRCPPSLAERLEKERKRRGCRSRHEVVLALLDEGAAR